MFTSNIVGVNEPALKKFGLITPITDKNLMLMSISTFFQVILQLFAH